MSATLKSIAKASGVSIGTVDRVIHDRGGVNENTKQIVLKIAEKLGYRSNIVGKALAFHKKPLKIGVLINSPSYTLFSEEIKKGIDTAFDEIKDFGVHLLYYLMENVVVDEQLRLLHQAENNGLDGLIIKPINHPEVRQKINRLVEAGLVVITCTSDISNCKRQYYVGHDHRKEGRIIGNILEKTLKKNASIVIIAGSLDILAQRQKTDGLLEYISQKRPDIKLLGTLETNKNIAVAITTIEAVKNQFTIEALCISGTSATDIDALCALFPANEKPLICVFASREVMLKSKNRSYIDFAIEEIPFQHGYVAIKTIFDILFNKINPKNSFIEISTLISVEECLNT